MQFRSFEVLQWEGVLGRLVSHSILGRCLFEVSCVSGTSYHTARRSKALSTEISPRIQDPDSVQEDAEPKESDLKATEARAQASFEAVLENAHRIQYDHFLIYYTRTYMPAVEKCRWLSLTSDPVILDYELGRLLACKGDKAGAKEHLDLVMSGV